MQPTPSPLPFDAVALAARGNSRRNRNQFQRARERRGNIKAEGVDVGKRFRGFVDESSKTASGRQGVPRACLFLFYRRSCSEYPDEAFVSLERVSAGRAVRR